MKRTMIGLASVGVLFLAFQCSDAKNENSDIQFTQSVDEGLYQLSSVTNGVTEMGRLRSMKKEREASDPVSFERINLAEFCTDVKRRYNDDAYAQSMKFANAQSMVYLLPLGQEFSSHFETSPNNNAGSKAALNALAPDRISQCATLRKRVEEQKMNIVFSIHPNEKTGHPDGIQIKISWEE